MAVANEAASESDPITDPELDLSHGPGLALTGRLGTSADDGEFDEPLPNGERRTFLEDGDTLSLRGYCERTGAVRIGLGEVSVTVVT